MVAGDAAMLALQMREGQECILCLPPVNGYISPNGVGVARQFQNKGPQPCGRRFRLQQLRKDF